MRPDGRWIAHGAALAVAGAGLALAVALRAHLGVDYAVDAEPAILALAHGDLAAFAHQPAAMGPLSLVLRAPVVAWALDRGLDPLAQYRLGAAVCLLPGAVLALEVGWRLWRIGRPWHVVGALVALLTLNPLLFNALQAGHPEEPLTASLCIGAVLLAPRRPAIAVALLVCALATKQWAIVAIGPVLFAMPATARRRAIAVLAASAGIVVIAYLAIGAGGVWDMNVRLFRGSEVALPFSSWWLIATGDGPARWVPGLIGPVTRVVTILAPLLVAAALARTRGRLSRVDVLGVLTLALLVRCVLDPADNPYYNLPAVFALAVWEVHRRQGMPWAAIATSVVLWLLIVFPWRSGNPDLVAAVYLPWTACLMIALALTLVGEHRRSAARAPAQSMS